MNAEERAQVARTTARQVADELAGIRDQVSPSGREGNGQHTAGDQRAFARSLIRQRLDAVATRRLRDDQPPLSEQDEQQVARAAYDLLYGLGGIQRYLDDPRVTDIHVQGCDVVFLKLLDGSWERGEPVADSDAELIELVRTAAARVGRTERRFDSAQPQLDLQLADGSRLFAVMEVSERPTVSIRKHQFDVATLDDLLVRGTVSESLAAFLRAAIRARRSIVIGGGPGTGKTTLMRCLLNEIDPGERLVTIEDALELDLGRLGRHPNLVALEARLPNLEGHGEISLEQLVRWALRMDPDRVCVGEVRGSEVLPMLLVMSQGRDGSMCTVHAGSARGVFGRLAIFAMLPPHRLTPEDTALLTANAVDLIVHLDKRARADGSVERFVTGVLEVRDYDGREVITNEVFTPGEDGRARPTGVLHESTLAALEQAGLDPAVLGDGHRGWA